MSSSIYVFYEMALISFNVINKFNFNALNTVFIENNLQYTVLTFKLQIKLNE